MLGNPALVRAEIDRRLTELRTDHVGGVQRDVPTKELARIRARIVRLIEACQEQLMSPDELRTRMPSLRQRGTTVQAQRVALGAELQLRPSSTTSVKAIDTLGAQIAEAITPFAPMRTRLDSIPGVSHRTAEVLIAEIGVDMRVFPTAGHLASWAGLCPGNNESAGKHRSGRTRSGNRCGCT